jgi:shikimate kinase
MLDGTNLFLIGMMGAGKSTLARQLAPRLGYQSVDTDRLVETCMGMEISEIFSRYGEAEFRTIESQVLAQVSSFTRLAIATGGGIVLQPSNWSHLRDGIVVWLDVDLEVLFQRLSNSEQVSDPKEYKRPLLNTENPFATLQSIYQQRQKLYAQADIRVEIGEDRLDLVSDRVIELLAERIEINRLKSKSEANLL